MKTPHSPNRTPHKHAELIKAWADGAEIQVKWDGDSIWTDIGTPSWHVGYKYRIKPEQVKIRYRNYIYRVSDTICHVYCTCDVNNNSLEKHPNFVRWIGDWVEVEV